MNALYVLRTSVDHCTCIRKYLYKGIEKAVGEKFYKGISTRVGTSADTIIIIGSYIGTRVGTCADTNSSSNMNTI